MCPQTRYFEPEAITMLGMVMSAIDFESIAIDKKPSEKFRDAIARRIIDAAAGGETDPVRIKQLALGNSANKQSQIHGRVGRWPRCHGQPEWHFQPRKNYTQEARTARAMGNGKIPAPGGTALMDMPLPYGMTAAKCGSAGE